MRRSKRKDSKRDGLSWPSNSYMTKGKDFPRAPLDINKPGLGRLGRDGLDAEGRQR